MRPIKLEMDGFASFREPTTVDFTEADYFVLVGPTGSGKSTVIDALIFALYGTAPRWGRANAVKDALAPTANRARVRLVFDVGASRYQVVRELRRTTHQVQQKTVMLERFNDPQAVDPTSEEVFPLAAEIHEVKEEIGNLLGLTYEEFTKSVVLPQGRFSEFLSATPKERQDILLKLLGADEYEKVRVLAAERSRELETRATTFLAQLEQYEDITPEALAANAERLTALKALHDALPERVAELSGLAATVAQADEALAALTSRHELLSAVAVPDGVGDLGAHEQQARAEVAAAKEAQRSAREAYTQAREAVQGAGNRAELEKIHGQWGEHALLTAQLPELESAVEAARLAAEEAKEKRVTLSAEAQGAATQLTDAQRTADGAEALLKQLQARRDKLATIVRPTDLDQLLAREAPASANYKASQAALTEAEQELAAALEEEPGAEAEQGLRLQLATVQSLLHARQELTPLAEAEREAHQAKEAADARLSEANEAARAAAEVLAAAQQSDLAATLRAELTEGAECPVCEQRVTHVPAAHSSTSVANARQAAKATDESQQAAAAEQRSAEREADKAALAVEEKRTALSQLQEEVDRAHPGVEASALVIELAAQLETLRQTRTRADQARKAEREARARVEETKKAVDALSGELRTAWEGCRTAQAELRALGVTVVLAEDDALDQAWRAVMEGSVAERTALSEGPLAEQHAAANTAAQAVEVQREQAERAAEATDEAEGKSHEAQQAFAELHSEANAKRKRRAEIEGLLEGRAAVEEIAMQLEALTALEATQRVADEALQAALHEATVADDALVAAQEATRLAWDQLRGTREELIPHGAPPIAASDLQMGWQQLVEWAHHEATEATKAQPTAQTSAAAARAAHAEAVEAVLELARQHEIEAEDAQQVTLAVASAVGRVESAGEALARQLKEKEKLARKQAKEAEKAAVASELANALRSNRFQKWLVGAALDVLVAAASESLETLSGGQFGLTHDKGEFFVIDHHDAESERSVRTLSGGETFQTSLALALALSEQLSTLSPTSAKLDSLFLDEGFGSLDADSLEIVALTLDRLAQGERMVGIVTHVPALAERVPVCFTVSRDSRTSHVERTR